MTADSLKNKIACNLENAGYKKVTSTSSEGKQFSGELIAAIAQAIVDEVQSNAVVEDTHPQGAGTWKIK